MTQLIEIDYLDWHVTAWIFFIFRWFLKYNIKCAPFVYRLINVALIGNYSDDPFLL